MQELYNANTAALFWTLLILKHNSNQGFPCIIIIFFNPLHTFGVINCFAALFVIYLVLCSAAWVITELI